MKTDAVNRAHQTGARGKVSFQIFDFEQVRHRFIDTLCRST
jgi:hypothetical protein